MRNATRPFLLDMEHGIFLSSHSAMFLLPGFNIPLNNLEVTFGKSFLMVVSVLNGVSTVDIIFLLMTIFAFLMLNTMSSAHDKIFGAKFSSFERFESICLYTACYAIF